MKYTIRYTPIAKAEIVALHDYIAKELMSPFAADRYINGILNKIDSLKTLGDVFAPSLQPFLRNCFGNEVRTIIYKKMTIVYTIIDNVVLIQRVMAGSLIL